MKTIRAILVSFVLVAFVVTRAVAQEETLSPSPPTDVQASDHPLDGGDMIDVTWELSADDSTEGFAGYKVYRSMTAAEIEAANTDALAKAKATAKEQATADVLGEDWTDRWRDAGTLLSELSDDQIQQVRDARAAAEAMFEASDGWLFVGGVEPGVDGMTVDKLDRGESYRFRVEAFNTADVASVPAATQAAVSPVRQWVDGARLWLFTITFVLCGGIVFWILYARSGRPIRVRKIAGLEAVDEAVGRATEMGRSCLFIPGIQDMNDIQTIAGITILARVARTAANYDARVEVPTSRSLVMATARETVQGAYLQAGRPDAYNEDLIYYVTDEQFGYVAYLSGMMVREKPAACFYMGSFFAESLILAETGNSIGAIQVAGTAQPAQLPFFVAACDYTLIGEEFFAASAYLSGSPEELGSLKGQDLGKLIVAGIMFVGIVLATLASIFALTSDPGEAPEADEPPPIHERLDEAVEYIRGTMLSWADWHGTTSLRGDFRA